MASPTASSSSEPTRSLNQQVILDEDEYTEALSHIIARDFFPSLAHLDATNSYLRALDTRDPELIGATVRRLEQLNTPRTERPTHPGRTPFETPYAAGPSDTPIYRRDDEPPSKRSRYDTSMSLDNFQARYTSEDNSSFSQILEDENRKRREKWAWAWDAQKRVKDQRDRMIEGRERLLIAAPSGTGVRERFLVESSVPAGRLTNGNEVTENEDRSSITTVAKRVDNAGREETGPEGEITRIEEVPHILSSEKEVRAAGVDGWEFKARNALMFPPDADQTPYNRLRPSSFKDMKPPPPKVILYDSTRLPEQDDVPKRSNSAPPSPTRSRIDAAIAGTPYRPKSPTSDNFSLVPSVPSPTPSELGPAAVKELMTWGTLNATPRVLSQSDDPAEATERPPRDSFQIAAPTAREQLSLRLSNRASKNLRAKAELLGGVPGLRTPSSIRSLVGGSTRRGSMPPPSWTPRKTEGNLTPAARRLLDRTTMGTAASRRAEVMGRNSGWEGSKPKDQNLNRLRWTPTPSPVTRRG